MASRVKIVFDEITDVVSVFIDGKRARKVRNAQHDHQILLEYDADGKIVGIEVTGASVLDPSKWPYHPDRGAMPAELLDELDRWLRHRWADLGRGRSAVAHGS
jgi:uncharacterized protein YuzE